ncbi:MFS transporter [Pontibacillus sp. ALD_SL1]|uniref:MFS transporter n=1 Tax=Pontibacillus sp. ALD_SL1 TaxID=2777185 RepID=UPI001A9728E0|nr:MFS transporter [Pontibacillus sp. ALD_SL1]QSS99467.1 MFS transporter [Pontibacillus sp. ALD_SL1]
MNRQLKGALFVFAIGVFMAALDNGIITASLTTLIYAFDVSATWGSWTITLYTLGLAISVPIIGKLSDQFGRKRLFMIEVTLFAVGSLCVALSPTFPLFLASRFLQSLGGGGIFIIASSYVLNTFPKDKQGRALGLIGGMNGIAAILGPNLGALILQATGSWHWLFLINIPISILLLLFGGSFIKEEEQEPVTEKMDWAGILFLTTAVLSLMYSLTLLEGEALLTSLLKPTFFTIFLLSVVLFVVLFQVEKRVGPNRDPILPLNLIKTPTFRWTLLLASFSGMILASVIFIPGYIEQYLDIPREQAGFWFTPLALASGLGAGGGGTLVDKKGPIYTLITASLLAIIGFLLFPLWVDTLWQMTIASSFVGAGFGMMLGAPINVLATENTSEQKGVALGTTSLFRQLGMTIAPTIYAGFLARSLTNVEEKVSNNLSEEAIPAHAGGTLFLPEGENLDEKDFESIKSTFELIQDEKLRESMLTSLHQVVGSGYNGLFISSLLISAFALFGTLHLRRLRKNQ